MPHVTVPLVLQLEYTVAASEAHMAEAKHKAAHVARSRATRGTEAALRVQSAQAAAQQRKDPRCGECLLKLLTRRRRIERLLTWPGRRVSRPKACSPPCRSAHSRLTTATGCGKRAR